MQYDKIYAELPLKARIKFYVAVFCTFAPMWAIAVTGFSTGRSWIEMIFYFASSGLIAVLWAYAFMRKIKLLFIVVPLQIALAVLQATLWRSTFIPFTLAGLVAIAFIITGYILFVNFINTDRKASLRLHMEIGLARQLHEHLVPPVIISLPAVEAYGVSSPSSEVGGDLVDGIVADGAAGLFVADVSGHGMKAGVMMSMVKSAIHMKLLHAPPDETLCADLNRIIHHMKRPEMFVTMACLYVNKDKSVGYVLAGHPPILHYRNKERSVVELTESRPGLGLLKDTSYPVHTVASEPGDIFVLLTDGIFEVRNAEGNELGLETIKRILSEHSEMATEQLAEVIMDHVRIYGPREDDQTLIVAKIL
jgi:sigma-B regulation protein RsbU (phosphoserine phosphatase)